MSPINIQTYDNLEVQTNPDLFAYSGDYEAQQRLIQGFEANTATAWGVQSAAETGLRLMQGLKKDDLTLSAAEATEKYGVAGKLNFNEPIPESIAKLRFNKFVDNQTRTEILDSAGRDNKGLEWFLQSFVYPTVPAIAEGLAGGAIMGAGSKVAQFLISTNKLAKFGALEKAVELGLVNPFALGSGTATGITRIAVGEAIYETILQTGIKAQAERNGYDYDEFIGLVSIAIAGGAGGLGGLFVGKQADKSLEIFGKTIDDYIKGNVNVETLVDDIVSGGVLSVDAVTASVSKMMADVEMGKITDPQIITAIQRVNQSEVLRRQLDDLVNAGSLDGIITKAEIDNLSDIDLYKIRNELLFKSYLKREGNVQTQYLIQYAEELNQKLATLETQKAFNENLGNVGIVESIQKTINNLLLEKSSIEASRTLEFNNIVDETLAKAKKEGYIKSTRISEKFAEITPTNPSQLTFEEFLNEYKILANNIRTQKVLSLESFLTLKEATRINIAKLFRLVDPITDNFKFKDLLNLSDKDLQAAYTKHLFGRQNMQAMTLEQAQKVLKETFTENKAVEKEIAASLTKETEELTQQLNKLDNAQDMELEELARQMNVPEQDIPDIIKAIEDEAKQADIEVANLKGLQVAMACLRRAR